jgi:SAM-dependent methyltransferase
MAAPEIVQQMQRDWDQRAQENAYHYIASGREDWDDESFYASGRKSVEEILLRDADRLFPGRDASELCVLEIGCGAGRMTRALADVVREVHAVDVSAEMVRMANSALAGRKNAFVSHTDGCGLPAAMGLFDLAFSYIVFQHIPAAEVIESYFRDVAARLKAGGVFKLQAQGHPLAIFGKQDTWEGCFIPALTWLRWSKKYGYRLLDFEGAGGQYLWLWWKRVARAEPEFSETELSFLEAEREAFERALRELAGRVHEAEKRGDDAEQRAKEEVRRLAQSHEALLAVYQSAAYRVGRRLGLAPPRLDKSAR